MYLENLRRKVLKKSANSEFVRKEVRKICGVACICKGKLSARKIQTWETIVFDRLIWKLQERKYVWIAGR
jgi:hypothetical protein